ncbi:hypothetical protein [Streptomyces sp. BPTC-684]|uniref:hypothetical protein n=1 Tax=Streptomyces sp. BPTC-684 TaxID=3043734 RepID=UPI0024B23D6F|nr:hypothetical protein [Streptomyces sp. BPTC-684]WHM41120.1 hypothetical protein QIY60_32520 [Streptomyces sp. BPTC-684]
MPKKQPSTHVLVPAESTPASSNRLTFAQVTAVIAFPVMGSTLALAGMPVSDIYPLLAYCGGIGVAVLMAASGGRKLAAGLAQLLLHLGR